MLEQYEESFATEKEKATKSNTSKYLTPITND